MADVTVPGPLLTAHLLDTQLRKLSFGRDGYAPLPPPRIASNRDLVSFINRLNAEGVTVYRRLSPAALSPSLPTWFIGIDSRWQLQRWLRRCS
jgi:hypothetical protein